MVLNGHLVVFATRLSQYALSSAAQVALISGGDSGPDGGDFSWSSDFMRRDSLRGGVTQSAAPSSQMQPPPASASSAAAMSFFNIGPTVFSVWDQKAAVSLGSGTHWTTVSRSFSRCADKFAA